MLNRKKSFQLLGVLCLSVAVAFICFPEAFIRRSELRFVGPHHAAPGQEVSYMVTVVDEASKAALSGVNLTLSLIGEQGEKESSRGVTDENGFATLSMKVPQNAEGGQLALRIRCKGAAIKEDIQFSLTVTEKTNLGRALLTSDKLLYQPGESIQARAVYKSNRGQVVKDSPVRFELLDSANTRISQTETKTNEFGVCFSELNTKKSLPEGRYLLRLLAKENSMLLASQTLTIKNYRLPSFRAVVIPESRSIAPGGAVLVSVQGRRANGAPLKPASYTLTLKDSLGATLDIQRNSQLNSWNTQESLSLAESFHLGEFGEQRLFIEAELTSESGEVSRSMAIIYASEQALNVTAMAEGGSLVPGIPNRVFIQLTGPGGIPARGQVFLKSELYETPTKIETDELGFAEVELVPERTISFHLQGWSEGQTVKRTVSLNVDSSSAGILRCSNYVTAQGSKETLSLRVNPSLRLNESESVLFLIERDGELISRQTFNIVEGVAKGEVTMPEEPGIYSVVAIVTAQGDFYKAKRRIIVQPTEALQLSLETSSKELAPGEKLQLTARVKGVKGPTALCIQAVDGALGSLGGLFPFQEKLSQFRFGDNVNGRLKRPYAQGALYAGSCSKLAEQALSGGQFRTTKRVFGHTAPLNKLRAKRLRSSMTRTGWNIFVATLLSLVFAGGVTLTVLIYRSKYAMFLGLILVVIMCGCCASFMTPTLLSARSKSSGGRVMSNLKMISVGGLIYEDEFGPMVAKDLSRGKGDAKGDQSVREYFPETLYYSPLLLTDETGEATVRFDVADSLTTWQIDVLASTPLGAVAHQDCSVITKKDVSLEMRAPAFLREGDECRVGVTIRNDSREARTFRLELKSQDWFELLSSLPESALTVKERSSQTYFFTLRVLNAGEHQFQCFLREAPKSAQPTSLKTMPIIDALKWPMTIRNFEVESARSSSGELSVRSKIVKVDLDFDSSESRERRVTVKIQSNPLVASLDGIERLIQEPHGCFEQTSSTTFPNALILGYLKGRPNADTAAIKRATTLLERGYRRLLGFEVEGGGFSLYGASPASPWLSAYGLKEFLAISKVMSVDRDIINRTRKYVLSTQRPNGAFGSVADSAYVVAVLIDTGYRGQEVDRGVRFLQKVLPEVIASELYFEVALIAEALAAWKSAPGELEKALSALKLNAEGLIESKRGGTLSGSYGPWLTLDTSCVATRAMIRGGRDKGKITCLLNAILANRSPSAAWGTTQSTVQALMTLSRGERFLSEGSGTVKIFLNRRLVDQLTFRNKNSSVVLDEQLLQDMKRGLLTLQAEMKGSVNYQVVTTMKVPFQSAMKRASKEKKGALRLRTSLSDGTVEAGQSTDLKIELNHQGDKTMRSPMIVIPLPGGVELVNGMGLKKAVLQRKIAHFEAVGSMLVLYLHELAPGSKFTMRVPLKMTWKGRFRSGVGRAYPYYNPEDGVMSEPFQMSVR